ncbi:hypothetical protein JA9_000235 [Meyerozyma sp. JA9]|nr:hypothetical protein JA9_000235 [Meyerozyma sp. JA9]
MVKRLLIRAGTSYDSEESQVVPVNSGKAVSVDSDIGLFKILISIKNFDGAKPHVANSFYNIGEGRYLNGEPAEESGATEGPEKSPLPNLRLDVKFTPKTAIKGSELLFGNDFTIPIKEYVPTTLLSTGLRFFTWFINGTVKGDVYGEKPYLYSPALNSFTYMGVDLDKKTAKENLNSNTDNILAIPDTPAERKKFFTKLSHCEDFVYNDAATYTLQFDTNFVKMADSKYSVSIPTYGNSTFDIDVLRYANEKLDNLNWTIKQGGQDGVGHGRLGLIVNFALRDE